MYESYPIQTIKKFKEETQKNRVIYQLFFLKNKFLSFNATQYFYGTCLGLPALFFDSEKHPKQQQEQKLSCFFCGFFF